MRQRILALSVALSVVPTPFGAAATTATTAGASTARVVIDFAEDTGGIKPNGFSSVDSPEVSFASTTGGLTVGDFAEGHGNSIAADDGGAFGGLEIRLSTPSNRISMGFGNDDPCLETAIEDPCGVPPPDTKAVLRLYRGATQVGQVEVAANNNDIMDQRIGRGDGPLFDRVVLIYTNADGSPNWLPEIVDDIRINPLCSVYGNEGGDVLAGTGDADVICGGGGNDTIDARDGNDLVFGGAGADIADAGAGLDTVNAGEGGDLLLGRQGDDVLFGQQGQDRLNGGNGADHCHGGPQLDSANNCTTTIAIP